VQVESSEATTAPGPLLPAPPPSRTWRAPLVVLALAFTAAIVREPGDFVDSLPATVVAAILAAITLRLTRPLPAPPPLRGRLGVQLACVAAFYLYNVLDAARVFALLDWPGFATLQALETWIAHHGVNPRWVVNPLLFGVLPAAAMLLLGATRQELGLQLGWRSGRTALLWCALPAAMVVHALATGSVTLAWVGRHALDVALQAAIGEELFDRGVLQSRLERFGPGWAVIGSAILFGLTHVPMQLHHGAPDVLGAAARCMVEQTTMGLVFALLFWRTRSLLPSMLLHTLKNLLAQMAR
jgi:membrane protease YdiL (CAAX protease family)